MAQASNRSEQIRSIKPFTDFLLSFKSLSLKKDKPISILRDLAVLVTDTNAGDVQVSFLKGKIDRLYYRLCCIQRELGALDLKNAKPGVTPEDYIFSGIDFSRYREIREDFFESFFLEGVADFPSLFFTENFGLCKDEIRLLMGECYGKTDGVYRLKKETHVILSLMRTLETSLDTSPLFTQEEIQTELDYLKSIVGTGKKMPDAQMLFRLLVLSLDNTSVSHNDNMITKLFISPQGDLSGTFRPGGKAWTRILVPV